jgi:uncharacterized membrane protein HdeD (DUF308 family)
MYSQFSRNWHLLAINGVIAILLGAMALFVPQETILIVAKYLGLIILLGGLVFLILAINHIQKQQPYGLLLTEAIMSIAIGIIIMVYTQETLSVFVILIGLWAIILGITELVLYASIKEQLANKRLVLINALLILAFGIIVFFNPFTAAVFLTAIVGIVALIVGVLMLVIAFQIRKSQKEVKKAD